MGAKEPISVGGTELKQTAKVDTSSDESDFEVNKIIKKKVLKKKVTRKKSDTSVDEFERLPAATLKSNNKKKKQPKSTDSSEDFLETLPTNKELFHKKNLSQKNILSEEEKKEESQKKRQQKVSESDKSSLDGILLSTDEDRNVREFYKSEDSRSEGSRYHFKNKKVQEIMSSVKKSKEKMVTSDSEPEIVKKEIIKSDIVEMKENDG